MNPAQDFDIEEGGGGREALRKRLTVKQEKN